MNKCTPPPNVPLRTPLPGVLQCVGCSTVPREEGQTGRRQAACLQQLLTSTEATFNVMTNSTTAAIMQPMQIGASLMTAQLKGLCATWIMHAPGAWNHVAHQLHPSCTPAARSPPAAPQPASAAPTASVKGARLDRHAPRPAAPLMTRHHGSTGGCLPIPRQPAHLPHHRPCLTANEDDTR